MPVHHDPQLDELAIKKCELGARPAIKAAADIIRTTGDSEVIINTYKDADQRGLLRPDLELTLVRIANGLAQFNKPITDVWPLIDAAQPVAKAKVGQKTLAKMVALRINRLMKNIKEVNDNELRHHNFMKTSPHYAGKPNPIPVPHEILGDIDTKEKLEMEFDRWAKSGGYLRDKHLRLLRRELLCKPELTDQDVKDGWGMVLAGIVMEE